MDPEIQVLRISRGKKRSKTTLSLAPPSLGVPPISASNPPHNNPSNPSNNHSNHLNGHLNGHLNSHLNHLNHNQSVNSPNANANSNSKSLTFNAFAQTATFCCFPLFLSSFGGIRGAQVQQAWREKVALCMIIGCVMAFVAYFTVGMRSNLCPADQVPGSRLFLNDASRAARGADVSVLGYSFSFDQVKNVLASLQPPVNLTGDWSGQDLSRLFDYSRGACSLFSANKSSFCTLLNPFLGSPNLTVSSCLSPAILAPLTPSSIITVDWSDLQRRNASFYAFDGKFMDLDLFYARDQYVDFVNIPSLAKLKLIPASDSTLGMSFNSKTFAFAQCLAARYTIARLGSATIGCSIYSGLMIIALVTVMGVILTRFLMALLFHWVLAPRMCSMKTLLQGKNDVGYLSNPSNSRFFVPRDQPGDKGPLYQQGWKRSLALPTDLYTICLVTCYSEDEDAIRGTLDSIAGTDYPDDRKLIFVVCDGLIHGAGNPRPTPEIVVSMVEQEQEQDSMTDPVPVSYLAIADGVKQHNMAQVYAGHYYFRRRPVPIIVVVKCGTDEERQAPTPEALSKKKPGNRGKRDSQLILMHFLSRVNFNDRMSALDYEIFWKIQAITGGVTPDFYQLLLMVDADTVINGSSLRYMVQTMVNDPKVMGLCGETRISNKTQSWVTMIQVYEYFTSHNLGKAFESVFGGVTCLPGCFCMYRIKATTENGYFVPLLVNPDIVACYSENIVDTLHKKNLLLLGEDRFLSTLMLGSFPRRKMVYVPQAVCHTTVPHTYKILQSQRRRWINSTIHNLLELVFLPTLCGTFCLSMQFVIGLELFGTVSLPIAIVLTVFLIISTAVSGANNLLPLTLLLLVLLLPGILVLMTTKKPVYILWMFVYLLALPIWNLLLPVYAFWHFDDFSWGDTRRIKGEMKQEDHSKRQGEYQIGSVRLKRWEEWELARRMDQSLPLPPVPSKANLTSSISLASALPKKSHKLGERMSQDVHISTRSAGMEPSQWSLVPTKNQHSVPMVVVAEDEHLLSITTPLTTTSPEKGDRYTLNTRESRKMERELDIPPRHSGSRDDDRLVVSSKNADAAAEDVGGVGVCNNPEIPIETKLAMKAGDTINQFWKSLYMEQFEEMSQGESTKPESSLGKVGPSDKSLAKTPIRKSQIKKSGLARHDTISSIASYMTAPQFSASSEVAGPGDASVEEMDDFVSVSSYSTTRSGLVQGSRPAPWTHTLQDQSDHHDQKCLPSFLLQKPHHQDDLGQIEEEEEASFFKDIETQAKTSTTTKTVQEFMRRASLLSNISSLRRQTSTTQPIHSAASVPSSSILDIQADQSLFSKSKVMGARAPPVELSRVGGCEEGDVGVSWDSLGHELGDFDRTGSRKVRGSRPMPPT